MRQEVIHVDAENLQHGLSAPNVAGGDEHMVVVRTNKRIDKVLEKYKRGNRSAKTIELHDFIMAYKANTEQAVTRCILEYLQSVNKDNPDSAAGDARRSFMVWTSQNVDRALQNYVRDEYAQVEEILTGKKQEFKLSVDVLKKGGKYKTLSDIGAVVEPGSANSGSWIEGWNDLAEQVRRYPPIFETHAHYNLKQYNTHREALLEKMHRDGIKWCIVPAIEACRRDGRGEKINCNKEVQDMFSEYDWILHAVGHHPKYLWRDAEWDKSRWEELEELLLNPKCVAIGETGLDYSYPEFCEEHKALQKEFFVKFIEMANKHQLPVILHIRRGTDPLTGEEDHLADEDALKLTEEHPVENGRVTDPLSGKEDLSADEDALKLLEEHPIENGAVCHCFEGDWALAQRYISCGVRYFGIGGKILYNGSALERAAYGRATYASSGSILYNGTALAQAVEHLPEECILLETDAPYLNTTGVYGPNTSYALAAVAERIAAIRNTTVEHVIAASTANAERLFGTQ